MDRIIGQGLDIFARKGKERRKLTKDERAFLVERIGIIAKVLKLILPTLLK